MDKQDLDIVMKNAKTGMSYHKDGQDFKVGQGGDGEYFLEKFKGTANVGEEEFYTLDSLVSAMIKIAPIAEWKLG